jgi:hypothetical protein
VESYILPDFDLARVEGLSLDIDLTEVEDWNLGAEDIPP